MKDKINIAELLKDCPKGMELYSPIYGVGVLTKVTDRIHVKFSKEHNVKCFRLDGKVGEDGEVMIFPKGKTTWEGFQRPFKDGDVVFYSNTIAIFKEWGDETFFRTYVIKYLYKDCHTIIRGVPLFGKDIRREARFATEEEKEKLFDAIKANGYKWNAETKTLEKLIEPKFKVGDKIIRKHRIGIDYPTEVIAVENGVYYCKGMSMGIEHQDEWELVPNKFDITTLKPFDKVLVRDTCKQIWIADFFSHKIEKQFIGYSFACIGHYGHQCIPYEGNEHLLGTTIDCDDFYKTW